MKSNEKGIAIIITLLVLVILMTLGTSLIYVTLMETQISANYKNSIQAFYAANAGVHATVDWLNNSYIPAPVTLYDTTSSPIKLKSNNEPVILSGVSDTASNYPSQAMVTAFQSALSNTPIHYDGSNSGKYSIKATLLNTTPIVSLCGGTTTAERWLVEATGSWGTGPVSLNKVSAIITRSSRPIVDFALYGNTTRNNGIVGSGSIATDSYDSRLGSYGGSNRYASGGNIGSNGNITLSGSSLINGNGTPGPGGHITMSGGARITGSTAPASQMVNFPTCTNFTSPCAARGTNINLSGNQSQVLSPGRYGVVQLSGSSSITFLPGAYTLDAIILSGSSKMTVSGNVTLHICDNPSAKVDMSGGTVLNDSSNSANFSIIYFGSNNVALSGSAGLAAFVYTPNANVSMSGGNFYGAFVGNSMALSGSAMVHYDLALKTNLSEASPYFITSWTRKGN